MKSPHASPPARQIGTRILLAIAGAILLAIVAVLTWGVLGFTVAASLKGSAGERLEHAQILLLPLAAVVGLVTGGAAGLVGQPSNVLRRWATCVAMIALLGVGVNGFVFLNP